jgi:hypothetical protein
VGGGPAALSRTMLQPSESTLFSVAAMASLFKDLWTRLAGGGTSGQEEPAADAVEYKGFRIRPVPYSAKGGYQTAGVIEKDFEAGMKGHRFVRAETHPSKDEAAAFAIAKGRQIIDEQGDRVFI